MMTFAKFICLTLPVLGCSVLLSLPTSASELLYTPVNPTFGGNPANAAGLQANAAAQNNYKAPPVARTTPQTALEKFNAQLQSALLSRLTSSSVSDLFDANGALITNRTLNAGNYIISITTDKNGNLNLTTEDKTIPGSKTTVTVGTVAEVAQ